MLNKIIPFLGQNALVPKHVVVTYYLAVHKEKIGDSKHMLHVHLHVSSQLGLLF